MCIICIEIDRDKIRFKDAIRNLREMYLVIDRGHVDEVVKKVLDLETKENKERIKKAGQCLENEENF